MTFLLWQSSFTVVICVILSLKSNLLEPLWSAQVLDLDSSCVHLSCAPDCFHCCEPICHQSPQAASGRCKGCTRALCSVKSELLKWETVILRLVSSHDKHTWAENKIKEHRLRQTYMFSYDHAVDTALSPFHSLFGEKQLSCLKMSKWISLLILSFFLLSNVKVSRTTSITKAKCSFQYVCLWNEKSQDCSEKSRSKQKYKTSADV